MWGENDTGGTKDSKPGCMGEPESKQVPPPQMHLKDSKTVMYLTQFVVVAGGSTKQRKQAGVRQPP